MQSQVGPQVDGVGKSVGSKFGTLFKVGALAAIGGAFVVGKFLKGAVDEAREAQIVTARTENVIKRMGGAANVSAKQVANLAGSISKKTGIDDEAIQSGQNLLLTFGNIRNEAGKGNQIFDRTSKLMVDMSAAMGTDAKGSAIQLGKALNDPVKGVSALTRVGVSFTEQQKKQIESLVESGKTLDAQKLILGEVEKQFGGAAEAMATPADKIAVAWGNVKEQIGTALLPVIDNVLNRVLTWMPAITAGINTSIAAVTGWVTQIRGLFSGGGGSGLSDGASSFASILTTTVLPALQSAGQYLATQLLPAVMGVINAFKYEFQKIAPIVVEAVSGMIARIAPYWPQIQEALKQVVSTFRSSLELIAVIVRTGTDILTALWSKFGQRFMDYLAKTFLNVVQIVRGALNIVQGIIRLVTALIKGDWGRAWDAVKQILRGAWQIIEGIVKQGINSLRNQLSNLGSVLKAISSRAWDLVKAAFKAGVNQAVQVATTMPKLVVAAVRGGVILLYNVGKDMIRGFINGIKSMVSSVLSAVGDVIDGAIGFAKSKLKIGSPSKLFHQFGSWTAEGLANGLIAGTPGVLAAVSDMGVKIQKSILEHLGEARDKTKGIIDSLKSDFASLRDSVASNFTGSLFEAQNSFDFLVNLVKTKGTLQKLKAAFNKLIGWGVAPQFLSSLFSNGGAGLILDLAKGDRISALTSASLFGDIGQLSGQLGGQVAMADIGPELRSQTRELREIKRAINRLPKDFGRELDNKVAHGQRRAS